MFCLLWYLGAVLKTAAGYSSGMMPGCSGVLRPREYRSGVLRPWEYSSGVLRPRLLRGLSDLFGFQLKAFNIITPEYQGCLTYTHRQGSPIIFPPPLPKSIILPPLQKSEDSGTDNAISSQGHTKEAVATPILKAVEGYMLVHARQKNSSGSL